MPPKLGRDRREFQHDPFDARDARFKLTTERLRALTGEQAKDLIENFIARNELTGILVHSQEFVDRIALEKINQE